MKRFLFAFFLLVLIPTVIRAQEVRYEKESVKIYFRQGKGDIDRQYMNNEAAMNELVQRVKAHMQKDSAKLAHINISSNSSPEGSHAINERLTHLRASSIMNWLNNALSAGVEYSISYHEADWKLFGELVAASSQVPYQKEVLDIINIGIESSSSDSQIYNQLRSLRGGVPHNWMYVNLFPQMRTATAEVTISWEQISELKISSGDVVDVPSAGANPVISYTKSPDTAINPSVKYDANWINSVDIQPDGVHFVVAENTSSEPRVSDVTLSFFGKEHKVTVKQAGAPQPIVTQSEPAPVVEAEHTDPFYFALKTNMLYDLIAIPNIGVEFYLGKNWTLAANAQMAWWSNERKEFDKIWRTYGGDVAVRKWFGRAAKQHPLSGHHVGLYGQFLTYDFCFFGDKGILADKINSSVGVEYGYSLPIARRLNIDFSLGVGYHWGEYKEYEHIDNHNVWQATKSRQYFGPTKLEVSLVWLLGQGNYNKDKGGRR